MSSYFVQQQRTISQSDCDVWWKVDFIWQPAMIISEAGPRRSSKALPKAKLSPKKGSWSLLVVCSQSEPLQLSESWWNHYIWNAQWEDEMLWKLQCLQQALVNRKGPLLHGNARLHITQPMLQNFNELDYKVLCFPSWTGQIPSRRRLLSSARFSDTWPVSFFQDLNFKGLDTRRKGPWSDPEVPCVELVDTLLAYLRFTSLPHISDQCSGKVLWSFWFWFWFSLPHLARHIIHFNLFQRETEGDLLRVRRSSEKIFFFW